MFDLRGLSLRWMCERPLHLLLTLGALFVLLVAFLLAISSARGRNVEEASAEFSNLEAFFEALGSWLLEWLDTDVVGFALPVAFSRFAIQASSTEPLWATVVLAVSLGGVALVNLRHSTEACCNDFAPLIGAQVASYVLCCGLCPGPVCTLASAFGAAVIASASVRWDALSEALAASTAAMGFFLGFRLGGRAFAPGLRQLPLAAIGLVLGGACLPRLVVEVVPLLFPVAELRIAYDSLATYMDREHFRRRSMELFIVTANVQVGVGYLGINALRKIQERKNTLLTVRSDGTPARSFVRHVLRYMAMTALPYMVQRTAMESVNNYAQTRWEYEIDVAVRIDTLLPAGHSGTDIDVFLAAVGDSNFTVQGYTSAATSVAGSAYSMIERKLFSLPKLALLPGMLMSQPVIVTSALPMAIGLDFARAHIMTKLTNRLERLRRRQQELASKRTKIEQHDTKCEEIIRRGGLGEMIEAQWRDIARSSRLLQIQYETLSLFKSFVNALYLQDFVAPGIEVVLGFLLEFGHIATADIWVYTRVIEDAIDMLLTRTRQEAALATMRTNIDRLSELQELLQRARGRGRAGPCLVDRERGELRVRGLKYQRGASTVVSLPDLTLRSGRVYAITGANGCGKSTFFSLIASCGRKAPVLPSGIEIMALESLTLPSSDVVEITQQLYCPLYATPRSWLLPKVGNLSADDVTALEARIASLSAQLNFQSRGSGGTLSSQGSGDKSDALGALNVSILGKIKDDWYNQLSGGQKCKVELIRQVFLPSRCPDVVLIDEAFAPLDPISKTLVQSKLKEHCADSIILAIHHTDSQEHCVAKGGFFDDRLHFENGTARLVGVCSDES